MHYFHGINDLISWAQAYKKEKCNTKQLLGIKDVWVSMQENLICSMQQ